MYDLFDGVPDDAARCPECGVIYLKSGQYGLVPHLIQDHTESEPARWLILQMLPGMYAQVEEILRTTA